MKQTEMYEAPQVQVIDMELQGMIASSVDGLELPGYGEGTW